MAGSHAEGAEMAQRTRKHERPATLCALCVHSLRPLRRIRHPHLVRFDLKSGLCLIVFFDGERSFRWGLAKALQLGRDFAAQTLVAIFCLFDSIGRVENRVEP